MRGLLKVVVPLAVLALPTLSACSTTANITDVYTALDGEGNRRRTVFFTDTKEIHCIGEAGVGRPDATIEGYIRQIRVYDFPSNSFSESDRILGYVELNPPRSTGTAPTRIDLRLLKIGPDGKESETAPYPTGSYICEMFLDGELKGNAAFNIDFPPCPPAEIPPSTPCFGFYPDGQECPKYGDRSRDPANCRCTQAKGWECDTE